MKTSTRFKYQRFPCRGLILGFGLIVAVSVAVVSCKTVETVTKAGTQIGVAAGVLTQSQAASIEKSTLAVAKTFQDITPEQEYYIGRTVGAVVLNKYKAYNKPQVNRYLNILGQTLARASDRPETFSGYRFLVLDSDDINAFAAPGGFVFVTRGMLRCCRHEAAVAAVLAHEIAHVQLKHGLRAIKQSRITSALTIIGIESAKTFAGQELATLTQAFEKSIADVTKTLINSGYSRAFESQADAAAVKILRRVGYNPNGLVDMLYAMQKRLKPGGIDFAKTHPSPVIRIASVQSSIGGYAPLKKPNPRQSRFDKYLRNI